MGKDVRKMIDKVKNFKSSINEGVEIKYVDDSQGEFRYITINLPTDINGEPVVYRSTNKMEVDAIINGESSGDFWRGEPQQYRNIGDVIMITTEPNPREVSKVPSRGNKEEWDSYNYVGHTVTKDSPLIIIDKLTGDTIFNNL